MTQTSSPSSSPKVSFSSFSYDMKCVSGKVREEKVRIREDAISDVELNNYNNNGNINGTTTTTTTNNNDDDNNNNNNNSNMNQQMPFRDNNPNNVNNMKNNSNLIQETKI